jgi:hypothetical protein
MDGLPVTRPEPLVWPPPQRSQFVTRPGESGNDQIDSLRPLILERIDFLGAYVSGDQRGVVGRKPEPFANNSGGPAPDTADISYGFDLAIARPKSDDVVTLTWLRGVLKVYVPSVMRPYRISRFTVAWFCPTLRGGVEKH